jgi:hypothetical protein
MPETPWYDTQYGLQLRIDEGLDGLHEIARARHEAHYNRNERLQAWLLLGHYMLDECGNFSRFTVDEPAMAAVVRFYAGAVPRDRAYLSSSFKLPSGRCDRCLVGWTLGNAHDCIWVNRGRGYDDPRHLHCHQLARIQSDYETLSELVKRAEIPVCSKHVIPNEYWRDDTNGAWLVVETECGRIKLGWRKRVLSIDWSASTLRASDIFADEDVTKSDVLIHAWTEEKAVEYLRKVWLHGRKK